MKTSSRFVIRVDHLDMYVRTEIDPGGMDAFWVARHLVDEMDTETAKIMMLRLEAKFPHRHFTMEPL